MSSMKFCKDCKYYRRHALGSEFAKCRHPRFTGVDMVTGKRTTEREYCDLQRSPHGVDILALCGPDAKFFEPRPPTFWQRLFAGTV